MTRAPIVLGLLFLLTAVGAAEEQKKPELPFEGPSAQGLEVLEPAFPARRERKGEDPKVRIAIDEALRWLAAHQKADGRWKAPKAEKGSLDLGVTALALLAYLGAGHTWYGDHPYAETVKRGIKVLRNLQREDGSFDAKESPKGVYAQAMAALVMIEAYGMTRSPIVRRPAQKALAYVQRARNPYFAWRYGVKPGDNDTSVTAWMLTAIHAARLVNEHVVGEGREEVFEIDRAAFDGARAWVEKMTEEKYGRVGYIQRGGSSARPQALIDRFPGERSEAMSAAGIWLHVLCGADPNKLLRAKKARKLLLARPPRWDVKAGYTDFYYWHWGTIALHQVGGRDWKTWSKHLRPAVIRNQRKDTEPKEHRGSWDPVGPWGPDGGRVYTTAILCLTLETPYRYPRERP